MISIAKRNARLEMSHNFSPIAYDHDTRKYVLVYVTVTFKF